MLRILQVLDLAKLGLEYIHVCALCGMKKTAEDTHATQ